MTEVRRYLDEPRPDAAPPSTQAAVVLMHLGGPDSMEDVEPFYRRLWAEPEITPPTLRSRLIGQRLDQAYAAAGEVLARGHHLIGGRSPAMDLAAAQSLALENRLLGRPVMALHAPGVVRVLAGHRFAGPSIAAAVASAKACGARHLVGVPLYPQAAGPGSALCIAELQRAASELGMAGGLQIVASYHDDPAWVAVLARRMRRSLDLIPPALREGASIVFAAESPTAGGGGNDAYLDQVEATAQAVLRASGQGEERAAIGWQSSRGPAPQLSPSVADLVAARGRDGVKAVLVVPLSVVTDGFETLHDLDIEAYQAAVQAGVKQYRRVPTLNADAEFIGVLARWVRARLPRDLAAFLPPAEAAR